jgi:copper chaperone CopZ
METSKSAPRASLGAALLAAILASSCCLGPLVLSLLGLGGIGIFGWIAPLRPYILGLTGLFLAAAFYLTYRRPTGATGDACGCEPSRSRRKQKAVLWFTTFAVAAFALAPTILVRAEHLRPSRATATTAAAVIHVDGIDCEACAAPMRRELDKVGGFHGLQLDVSRQTVTVDYDPGPGRPEVYVKAIDSLGYEASLSSPVQGRSR